MGRIVEIQVLEKKSFAQWGRLILIVCHDYVDGPTYISLLIDTTEQKNLKNVIVCLTAHGNKVWVSAWYLVGSSCKSKIWAITSLIRKKTFNSTVRARTLMELGRIFNYGLCYIFKKTFHN